jgi:hypothetical protein
MEAKLITITDYCKYSQIETEFISLLKGEGLIEVYVVSGEEFIAIDQMPLLEQYARWYYEMEINLEGIDALRHMLERVRKLQNAMNELENKLRIYEGS